MGGLRIFEKIEAHGFSTRIYVKKLSSLMLDIKNMFKEDKLFNLMSRLQG